MLRKNLIAPTDYYEASVFEQEKVHIFDHGWHLVGLARDVPELHDWRLVSVAGTELILQNIGQDVIRGFTNVCPHRFNAIRQNQQGNGPLRCSYHLWSFDNDGVPTAVPHRDSTVSLDDCKSNHLQKWAVERCGEFLFAALAPTQSLEHFLGSLFATLRTFSDNLGEEVDSFEQRIAANWKVILQNTVEFDHVFSVHPTTFAPTIERPIKLIELDATAPHIAYLAAMQPLDKSKPGLRRVTTILGRSALPLYEGYAHWTLFPSTTFGITRNRQITLIHYQPLSPQYTEAHIRVFATKIDNLSATDQVILDHIHKTDCVFTRQLVEEDRLICESVQKGLSNAPDTFEGCLLPSEELVGRLQSYWINAMKASEQAVKK